MELKLLRAFLAVAELRHFGHAAEALNVSQPALSKQIVALEESLGARLFERGRHGAELTTFGAGFLADAQALVRQALEAKVSAFVFCSSISAFGTISAPVLTEAEPSVDVGAYGLTKLLGEKLLQEAAGALPSLSIRLPAVIGRGWLTSKRSRSGALRLPFCVTWVPSLRRSASCSR